MEHVYQIHRWVVMVVTYDNNKHYRNFGDFDEAVAYRDHALDDTIVVGACLFEKTSY